MAFEEYQLCIKPEPDTIIWRYMSLGKFKSLLEKRGLFFCRADRFADPYEGSIPKREAEYRIEAQKQAAAYHDLDFDLQRAQRNISGFSERHKLDKQSHIINCWHINNAENDSMWRLYLDSNEGVAIKTNVAKLESAFANTGETIYCSEVRYLDYEQDIWYDDIEYPMKGYSMFIPLVHKRNEFRQEAEIRLIHPIDTRYTTDEQTLGQYWKDQVFHNGKIINVEVSDLIEAVYTPPTSDEQQNDTVRKMISQHNFNFKVIKSSLSSEPYY